MQLSMRLDDEHTLRIWMSILKNKEEVDSWPSWKKGEDCKISDPVDTAKLEKVEDYDIPELISIMVQSIADAQKWSADTQRCHEVRLKADKFWEKARKEAKS